MAGVHISIRYSTEKKTYPVVLHAQSRDQAHDVLKFSDD
jgi:hypothetical protein